MYDLGVETGDELGNGSGEDVRDVDGSNERESAGSHGPDIGVDVVQSIVGQVVGDAREVVGEGSYERGYLEVTVGCVPQGEVVGLSQDLNSIWEDALSSHVFLKC